VRRARRCAGKPTRHLARAWVPDLETAWPALEDERIVDGATGHLPPSGTTSGTVTRPSTVTSRTLSSARSVSGLSGSSPASQTGSDFDEGIKNHDWPSFSGGERRSRSRA
jgi:hypothetical protein